MNVFACCEKDEAIASTDSNVPEVILNWHHAAHLKDAAEQKWHGCDVTDCHAVRKRALSCLLDVCPAGHPHR